jgi:ADP-dependent NAD(P)H-hydrate dehydratase / NAD(P)H-hydrate epimerase
MRLVTRDEMREMDQATIDMGTPGAALMERAGQGVVRAIRSRYPDLAGMGCVVVAGSGNNGGDGLVAARGLREHGAEVTVFATAPAAAMSADARAHYTRYEALGARVRHLQDEASWRRLRLAIESSDLVLDALLGTGFQGPVRGPLREVIGLVNDAARADAAVVAVDVPSGLDADTGAVANPCVIADLTVTFGFPKVGCYVDPGRGYVGELERVDIGLAAAAVDRIPERYRLLDPDIAAELVPVRARAAHKAAFGRLLVIGGSRGMSGAPALAGMGALRSGAGLVTIAVPATIQDRIATREAEVMTLGLTPTGRGGVSVRAVDEALAAARAADAIAIGPGLSREPETAELVRHLVRAIEKPIVLDADGLNAFAGRLDELAGTRAPLILTPHAGEMARLVGLDPVAVESDRIRLPQSVAAQIGHVVLLKGSPSVVAAPGRPLMLSEHGNPGMATAGAGDVLSGVILGLLGQGLSPYDAAALGMVLHAVAGDHAAHRIGEAGLIAGDIVAEIPRVLELLVRHRTWEVA